MERVTNIMLSAVFALLLLSTHALAADSKGYVKSQTSAPTETIFSKAVNSGSHNLFLSAVEEAGLAYLLDGQGPYTVLLPTDDAINRLPAGTWARLTDPQNRDLLRAVVEYNILPGSIKAADFDNLNEVDTLFGRPMGMTWYSGNRRIGGRASITSRDMMASNGYYHSVDSVLLPPTGFDVIADSDDFVYFGEAVRVAGIAEMLDANESYTFIVPRDSAFASIPEEDLDMLLEPENRAELRSILNHYVLPGNWSASELRNRTTAVTISGQELDLMADGDTLLVNEVRVVDSIPVYNGTIHIVDEVIYPDTAVAGSFMQRGSSDNDRYYYYGEDSHSEKCYFEDDSMMRHDSKGSERWNSDDHGWKNRDHGWHGDSCGCGHGWHGKSWSRGSSTPKWWTNWAY